MKHLIKGTVIILGLLVMQVAMGWAHDTWIEATGDGVAVLVGHHGEFEPYESERVVEIVGYGATGWPVVLDLIREKEKSRALVDEPFAAYTAVLDNQYWLQTTEGWKNQRDKAGLSVLVEGRSYKYAKHLSRWEDYLTQPMGQRFEVVPMKNPSMLKEGDSLPVQIYFEGQPLRQARLSAHSDMKGDTHELKEVKGDGPFTVTIGPPGPQLITAKHVLPVLGDKQLVWLAATLTFKTAP